MGWIVVVALVALVGVGIWRFAGLPRAAMELLGAALLLGIAGYAWQGTPGLAGKPTPPKVDERQPDSEFAKERTTLLARFGGAAQVLDAADAFHREGLNLYAVGLIKGALERNPENADLWVGLGNALVIHGEGMMSPAAQLAFERAAKLAPDHPGPPFFMGLAYAQAGQIDRAEQIWRDLLARAPADAPWRGDLEQRLAGIQQARGQ